MKRLILSVLTSLLLMMPTMASEIEIVPTMQSRGNAPDRVWVGTFQIVWNDFMDKIVHNPIRFPEGTPGYVKDLNMQAFKVEDISNESFYKYFGKVTKKTKKNIVSALKRKFNETSDIIDKLDLTPGNDKYLMYAMLKKNFEFIREFDELGQSNFRTQTAKFFGINKASSNELNQGVKVLFYNSPRDFAVMLDTKGKDEVYLYRTPTSKPFGLIYADMLKKQALYKGDVAFLDDDELKIPNLSFATEREYDDISNKRIMGSNYVIDKAIQTVKFDMDKSGVELKSEAALVVSRTCLTPPSDYRYFYFDNTFVMFIKEKNKQKPYLALRVHNIDKFQ